MKPFKTDPSIQLITADDVSTSFEGRGKSYSNSKYKSRIKTNKSSQKPNLKSSLGEFSRSARKDLFEIPKTPGPGQYDFWPSNKGPAYTLIGKSKEIVKAGPGPGSYEPDLKATKKGWKIGKSQRSEFFCKTTTPGPGQYEKPNRPTTPSWGFSKDHESCRYFSTPGPGAYETKALHKGIQYQASKAKRKDLFHSQNTPGPGTYESANLKSIFIPALHGNYNTKVNTEAQSKIPKNKPNFGVRRSHKS